MLHLQLFIPIILFLSIQGSSVVYGSCEAFEDVNATLTSRHIPPHVHLVSYPPLHKIMKVNYQNISELYTALVERHQSATTVKNVMAKRISDHLPSPRQNCFIQERNESTFFYNPSDNHTARLIEDTKMLRNASKALQMMIDYERSPNMSRSANLTLSFVYLKTSLDSIIEGLCNLTGEPVQEVDTIIGSGDGSDDGNQPPQNTNDDERNAPSYNSNSNNPHSSTRPTTPPRAPPTEDPRSGDGDLFDQIANSQSFGRPITQNRHRNRRSVSLMMPAGPNCMRSRSIDSVEDEFVSMYEIWIGMWYVQSDLLKIKEYLNPN